MSVLNGVQYVNGSAEKFAIVKHDEWYNLGSGRFVSFKHPVVVTANNNTTVATEHIVLKWEKKICETKVMKTCKWVSKKDELTISDVADSPEEFNNSIGNHVVTITSYNNSVTPYTLIYIPPRWNIIKETVVYKNNSASWYPVLGEVETNSKGTEYVEFTNNTLYVADPNHVIARVSEYYVINEAPLDWGALEISVQTPYVLVDDLAWHVVVVHSKPSDYVAWKLIVVFVFVLGVFLVAGYYAVNAGRV